MVIYYYYYYRINLKIDWVFIRNFSIVLIFFLNLIFMGKKNSRIAFLLLFFRLISWELMDKKLAMKKQER